MRIALVVCALQVGGLETVLKSLGEFLRNDGHEVDFVETTSKGKWSDYFADLGFNVVTVIGKWWRSRVHHARRLSSALRDYDVVMLNDTPYAQSVLGLLREDTVVIPILHLGLPSCMTNAIGNSGQWDTVVTVGPGLRNVLLKHAPIPADRVVCIPNGVGVPASWPKVQKDFVVDCPLKVVYIGRIEKQQKGVMHLPRIMRKVRDRNLDLVMNIIGDGPDRRELRDSFVECCPGSNVSFHGALGHQETLKMLSAQDVLIMPSYFEGMPIALLEAMSAGVVPVVSKLPGHTDHIVKEGENGFLIGVGNEDGFANALYSVGEDRDLLRRLSKAAWKTISERFSVAKMGESYLKVIKNAQEAKKLRNSRIRSRRCDISLLGDLPFLTLFMVRPVRKALRMAGLLSHIPNSPHYASGHNMLI